MSSWKTYHARRLKRRFRTIKGDEMYKYQKIETVFERDMDGTKRLIPNKFRDGAVEYLKDNMWEFTEKIDGTNIGVYWDGHQVSFQGRTEKADIPKHLLKRLEELFGGGINEQVFEMIFGEKEAVLFGEGYGAKIQKAGKKYNPDGVDFILFDVYIPSSDIYLERVNILNIAMAFGVNVVPIVLTGTIDDAVEYVKSEPKSTIGCADMEGLVGKPQANLRNRKGERIIVKIKCNDFKGE